MAIGKQNVTSGYFVDDWLCLHNLYVDTVRVALTKFENFHRVAPTLPLAPQNGLLLKAENAWKLAAESLSNKLPNLEMEISQVAQGSKRNFYASSQNSSYTLIEDDSDFPTVSMSFNGSAADILCVAHEFGHVLQLYLAGRHFIPPMYREIAAFLAECIFLEYMEEIQPDLGMDIRAAWELDNQIYFENDGKLLLDALKTPQISKYNYRYNYPLARSIAAKMKKTASEDDWYLVFHGNLEAIKTLIDTQLLDREKEMQNYLPEVPEPEANRPAINAYRSLGMMVLLDIDYWQGESERTIEEYYVARLAHLQSQTALVAIEKERKPVGYAIWDIDQTDTNIIRLQRQAAPFGHHLALQAKLQARFPKDVRVLSHHTRSAREEQVAW
ncbi:MAG: hypothetical protein F4223_03405 [Rhodobacteraceae bacterium]|nr:hypothetical protein [Paracoccaceae bacterium]